MFKNKKIRLYVHHGGFIQLRFSAHSKSSKIAAKTFESLMNFFYVIGSLVIKVSAGFQKLTISIFFHTGSALISVTVKSWKAISREYFKTKELWPKRLKLASENQFGRALLIFLIVISLTAATLGSLKLVAKALNIKTDVLKTAQVGRTYLEQAKTAFEKQDFANAQLRFNMAFQAFGNALGSIDQSSRVINRVLDLAPQKKDADNLLKAAGLVAKTGQNLTQARQLAQGLVVGPGGISAPAGDTPTALNSIWISLKEAASDLSLAQNLVNNVNISNFQNESKDNLWQLKDNINFATAAVNNFYQLFSLVKTLCLGQKNVLLLFENNNELRPSGGFVGTFGSLKINNGKFSKINVSSIYDLDGQLQEVIRPPQPVLNVNGRWYMRDAGWFADFQTSAKKFSSFYEREGGETPDLIVAITPNIIADWLKLTGPIQLPTYGIALNSDNFVELTQATTSGAIDLPTNSPKQMLADFFPIFLDKLSHLDKNDMASALLVLENNLNSKQILAYSRDPELQNIITSFHWDGGIYDSDRDYLAVVSANLGGTKTDLAIRQNISLTTTIAPDGTATNDLTITRQNQMPDLPHADNLSFIRILVPKGSNLISATGFDLKNIAYPENVSYTEDEDVKDWQKKSVTDNFSGTVTGSESGKTFFGNWLYLKGGQSKTVKISYQLPFKVGDIDRYSLLLQKQGGAAKQEFNWSINFDDRTLLYKTFGQGEVGAESFSLADILDKDAFYGLIFQKK